MLQAQSAEQKVTTTKSYRMNHIVRTYIYSQIINDTEKIYMNRYCVAKEMDLPVVFYFSETCNRNCRALTLTAMQCPVVVLPNLISAPCSKDHVPAERNMNSVAPWIRLPPLISVGSPAASPCCVVGWG